MESSDWCRKLATNRPRQGSLMKRISVSLAALLVGALASVTSAHTLGDPKVVKDVNPAAAPSTPQELTVVGDTLFFAAEDGVSSHELWKTKGTEASTQQV